MDPFTYSSQLHADDIRLLYPVSTSRQGIYFNVLSVSRRSAPDYTAVSYTWGNDEASEVIFLEGKEFRVRPNLWSCLYYLTYGRGRKAKVCLWVDAICINQADDVERSAQVRRMDQTYQDAQHVSVWLGLPPIPPHAAAASLPTDRPILTLEYEADEFVWADDLRDLANRPYWSRFWVIQEMLLGRAVILWCGNTGMAADDFQNMLCLEAGINQFGDSYHDRVKHNRGTRYAAIPLVMARHIDRHPEFLQPLRALLVAHHRSMCKDPRDRVFALLGLVTVDERTLLDRFLPDYSLSEEEVLVIALAHLTQASVVEDESPREPVTVESEELFLGLGVPSKERRRQLLQMAAELDYLGSESLDEVQLQLEHWDETEAALRLLHQWDLLGGVEDAIPRESQPRSVVLIGVVIVLSLATAYLLVQEVYRRIR